MTAIGNITDERLFNAAAKLAAALREIQLANEEIFFADRSSPLITKIASLAAPIGVLRKELEYEAFARQGVFLDD